MSSIAINKDLDQIGVIWRWRERSVYFFTFSVNSASCLLLISFCFRKRGEKEICSILTGRSRGDDWLFGSKKLPQEEENLGEEGILQTWRTSSTRRDQDIQQLGNEAFLPALHPNNTLLHPSSRFRCVGMFSITHCRGNKHISAVLSPLLGHYPIPEKRAISDRFRYSINHRDRLPWWGRNSGYILLRSVQLDYERSSQSTNLRALWSWVDH